MNDEVTLAGVTFATPKFATTTISHQDWLASSTTCAYCGRTSDEVAMSFVLAGSGSANVSGVELRGSLCAKCLNDPESEFGRLKRDAPPRERTITGIDPKYLRSPL